MEHWMTTKRTAGYIGVHPDTVRRWRMDGTGPSYIKLGSHRSRQVRYRKDVVDEWLERHEVRTN